MLATIYDSPIYQTIYALMDSVPFVYVNAIGCIVLIIVFALYAFSREGRDEHGRAIIGSACLWGTAGALHPDESFRPIHLDDSLQPLCIHEHLPTRLQPLYDRRSRRHCHPAQSALNRSRQLAELVLFFAQERNFSATM